MLTPSESSLVLARLQSTRVPSPIIPTKREPKVDRFDRTGWVMCLVGSTLGGKVGAKGTKREGMITDQYLPTRTAYWGVVTLGDRTLNVSTLESWVWATIQRVGNQGMLDRVRKQVGDFGDLVNDCVVLILSRAKRNPCDTFYPYTRMDKHTEHKMIGTTVCAIPTKGCPIARNAKNGRTSTYWSARQAQSAYRFAQGATLEKVRYINGVRAMDGERFPDGVHIEYRMEMVRGKAPQRMSEMYDAPAKEESAVMDSELYAEMEKLIGADIVEQVKIGIEQAAKVSKPRKDRRIDARTNRYESRFDLTTIVATAKGISRSTAGRMLMEARDKCIQKGMVAAA